jgi:EmrB/QacA subfamily drug resistance transporter
VSAGGRGDSSNYRLLLITVALGSILAPLNSTMLAVALPEIRGDFSVGLAEIGWLVSAYLIAMAVAQPLGGRLGDQLGRATMLRFGLVAFLAFSLAAAVSPVFPVLVILRTGQALVGAAVIPNGMAMLRESVPSHRLGRSGGLIGSAISISAGVGPLVGAGLLALGSWRLLFLVNVPVVALALVSLTALRYPQSARRRRFEIDWAGALAFALALISVTFLLNSLSGGQSAYLLIAGILALLLSSTVFFRRQLNTAIPIAEWRLFRHRSYSGATFYMLLSNLVMYTTLLSIPFFIEEVQGKGSGTTGLLLGIMSIQMAILAPISGRIADSRGRRLPVLTGSLVVLTGVIVLLAGLDRDVSFGYLAFGLAILGFGIGLSFGPAGIAAIESAPRDLAGAAAGTNSMMRYLGSILGAGILGAVLASDSATPGVDLFRLIFIVLVVMAALAAASAALIHRFPPEAGVLTPSPASGLPRPSVPAGSPRAGP